MSHIDKRPGGDWLNAVQVENIAELLGLRLEWPGGLPCLIYEKFDIAYQASEESAGRFGAWWIATQAEPFQNELRIALGLPLV